MSDDASVRPADTGPYVFVSYASVDRGRVLSVVSILQHSGLAVWMDLEDIGGGASYGPEIVSGIKGADAILLMCSAAALASRNVRQEIQLAWRFGRPILPLRLDPVEFPEDLVYWLEGAQWIEILDRSETDWLPRIQRTLRRSGSGSGFGSAEDQTALMSVEAAPSNLPPALTALIGRDQDVTEVRTLLANGRLVTLTGPGGTGKTRLAIEAARGLGSVETFPDGIWFVDLAPLTDPALVPSAVAAVLQVAEQPGQSLVTTLTATLAERTILLLLDNVEQVAGAAPFIAALVDACPGLSVLATSRVPLRLPTEWAYPVAPLETPDPRNLPPVPTLARNPAVRLFVDRARETKSDFALTADNARSVAEICRRLDGLPLALELAAARTKLLPPAALLARLGSRLNVLTRGPGTSPRQQTLRATIAWSYDLLTPGEQSVFRRLAVFAGGGTLVAAEAVGSDRSAGMSATEQPEAAGHDTPVIDAVAELVDQSLLRIAGGTEDEPRFQMLETIREFGLEILAANGEAETAHHDHAAYFSDLAIGAEPDLVGPRQAQTLATLDADHDNFRVAIDHFHRDTSAEAATAELQMAAALGRFWVVRGYFSEGRVTLERALEREAAAPAAVRAEALNALGVIVVTQGDGARGAVLHEQALALAREIGDDVATASALANLGVLAELQGDYPRAIAFHEEALALRRTFNDRRLIAVSLLDLGMVAYYQGDHETAAARIAESLPIFRHLGDTRFVATGLETLGALAYGAQNYPLAASRFTESLALWRILGDRHGTANSTLNLARSLYQSGDLDRSAERLAEVAFIYRDLGDKAGLAIALWSLARISLVRGDVDSAAAKLAESLPLCLDAGERRTIVEGIEVAAAVANARGFPEKGARLLGAAAQSRIDLGAPLNGALKAELERTEGAIRVKLDDHRYAAAWSAGSRLDSNQAFAEAMTVVS